jgi:hypothetical protein
MAHCTLRVTAILFGLALMLGGAAPRVASAQGYTEAVCGKGEGGILLSVQDGFIALHGGICPNDDRKFRAFLKTVNRSIRTIKLVSGGGNAGAPEAIGNMIRGGGYNTG